MACLLGGSLLLGACSSEMEGAAPEGKGAVMLDMSADMGFNTRTKAVDEDTYVTDHLDDYTVRILKDGELVSDCEWKKSELPEGLIELNSGSYTLEASYGKEYNENPSTRDGIYMYGSTDFDVNSGQTATQTVNCTPACGKLVVKFGADMAKYFSDYSVYFTTQAASGSNWIIWPKEDTDPLYVKLTQAGESVKATFNLTKTDGTEATVDPLTRTMKWGTMWTITVNPKVESTSGKVGITITFDDSTTDKPIDIEIPSDWL